MESKQAKHACFTINNYTEECTKACKEYFESGKCNYMVLGFEVGESGTTHIQGYLQWPKVTRWATLAKAWKAHFESARGTGTQASDYCKKEKNFIEFGELRDTAGGRVGGEMEKARWADIRARVAEGASTIEIVEDHPDLLANFTNIDKHFRNYQRALKRPLPTCEGFIPNPWGILMPLKQEKQRHYWVFSTCPNVGKTTMFLEPLREKFRCSWYNKLENFQVISHDSQFILIDEYSTAHLKVTQLNEMCDGNYQYPVKGGDPVQVKATIIICGNRAPNTLYRNTWEYLAARFNVVEINDQRKADAVDLESLPFLTEEPSNL